MPLDIKRFAEKLRECRRHFDISAEALTTGTGISGTRLKALEAAESEPSGDEILILADFFQLDYQYFISEKAVGAFDQTDVMFRRYGNELSSADRRAIQEFVFLCECEGFLRSELRREPTKTFSFQKRGTYFKAHGAEAAEALRRFLGYAPNEIRTNVFSTLRELGVHVFRRELRNSRISGLCLRHPQVGPCVLVNYSEDVFRQQFTAAHEAGHAFLDEDDAILSGTWNAKDLSEIRANVFGSQFLMPPEYLRSLSSTTGWGLKAAIDWASRLKVSTVAFSYALLELGVISEADAQQLRETRISAANKEDSELPPSLSPAVRERRQELLRRGLSTYYVTLCFDGFREGIISAGRLAEMLLVRADEVDEVAAAFGETVAHGR